MGARRVGWLFGPWLDLLSFGAPAVGSLLLCAWLSKRGGLDAPLSPLMWLWAVVLVDVAHVYGTVYRVYGVPAELRRRPRLYFGVPALCYAAGVLSYAVSALWFWRVMAYVAVIHFVRQQAGWVALSWRRDAAVPARWRQLDRWLDQAAIYTGTLYPVLWWHGHLPRRFHWFIAGDFARFLPAWLPGLLMPVWLAVGGMWLVRQAHRAAVGQGVNAAKLLVMLGTWATWYAGIMAYDSDVAFTVTNVTVHGVPYMLVVWRWHRAGTFETSARTFETSALKKSGTSFLAVAGSLLVFYLPLGLAAVLEEGLWDRLVWHDHPMLFPLPDWNLGTVGLVLLAPLLSLPQSTHYLLDAWIWRSGENPDLGRRLGL